MGLCNLTLGFVILPGDHARSITAALSTKIVIYKMSQSSLETFDV